MKGNKALTILLALVLVVAFTYLMTDYARQQKRQAAFAYQIEDTERALSILPTPAPDLEQKLADITAAGEQTSQALTDSALNSTSVIDSLLLLADSCDLKITPLTAQSWAIKKVGESQYKVLPLDLQVQGSLNNLIDFARKIGDSQKYPNLLITALQISRGPGASPGLNPDTDSISADLSVAVVKRLPSNP